MPVWQYRLTCRDVQVLAVHGGELGWVRELDGDDAEPAGADVGGLAARAVVVRGGLLQPRAHLRRVAAQDAPVGRHPRLGGRPRLPLARHQRPPGAPHAHRPSTLLQPPQLVLDWRVTLSSSRIRSLIG